MKTVRVRILPSRVHPPAPLPIASILPIVSSNYMTSIHTDLYAHMDAHTHIGQRQLLAPRPTQDTTNPTIAALTTATGPSHVTVRPLLLWQSRSYLGTYGGMYTHTECSSVQ